MSQIISFSGQYPSLLFRSIISFESSPYHQMIKKMNDIDSDYFDKIPACTEQLPSELDFQLKDNILKDFGKLADELLGQELKSKCLNQLIKEWRSVPNHDNENRETLVKDTMASIKQIATLYFSRENPCPKVDEETLQRKYKKAKRRSLGERIIQSNNADVIDFHHALMYKTVWECKELIEDRTIKFIEDVMKAFVTMEIK